MRHAGQLPPRDKAVLKIAPVTVTTDWTLYPYSLWGATKITLNVAGNPIEIQFAHEQPPNPPTWDDPIPVPVGFWSHVGPFGYVRFRFNNQITGGQNQGGGTATVYGALYAE